MSLPTLTVEEMFLACKSSLSGITYVQAYQYWRAFPGDPRIMKSWVRKLTLILRKMN